MRNIQRDIMSDAIRTCIEYKQEIKSLRWFSGSMVVVNIVLIIILLGLCCGR